MMLECYGFSCSDNLLGPNGYLSKALRWLRRWVGAPLAFAALLFVGRRIYIGWATIQMTVSQISPIWLLAGVGVVSLSIFLLGWNWIYILVSRGARVYWPSTLALYLLTNLTRYLPGGVWHFVGRTAWLTEQGYKSRSVIESLVLEQMMTLISAGAVGFALSGLVGHTVLAVGLGFVAETALVLLAGIATGCVWPVHKGFPLRSYRRGWRCVFLVLSYNLFWILNGFATVCLFAATVGWERTGPLLGINLVGQTALSWAAGYVVLFVPGGWGVREMAFIHLLSHNLSGDVVVFLPVLSRLVQVVAELLCGAVFPLVWRLVGQRTERKHSPAME